MYFAVHCILCAESVLRNQSGKEVDVRSAVMSILKYAKYRKGGSWQPAAGRHLPPRSHDRQPAVGTAAGTHPLSRSHDQLSAMPR